MLCFTWVGFLHGQAPVQNNTGLDGGNCVIMEFPISKPILLTDIKLPPPPNLPGY